MAETAFAHALKKSGFNTNAALARTIAEDELRKASLTPLRALASFVEELRDAGGIMAEVVSKASTRHDALAYLQRVADDMRGDKLQGSAKADDGVLSTGESRNAPGPVNPAELEGGR